MQGVEQYAWKKATPLLKNQGKYHSVDQREADLKKCLEKLRAACYIQDMADFVAVRDGLEGPSFYPIYVLDLSTIHYTK